MLGTNPGCSKGSLVCSLTLSTQIVTETRQVQYNETVVLISIESQCKGVPVCYGDRAKDPDTN